MLDSNEIMDMWPKDVSQGENGKFRSINILVKFQETYEGGGENVIDKMEQQIDKTKQTIEDIKNDKGTEPSRGIKQKDLKNKIKKLINAKTIYGIALPLPNELSDSQDHQWETSKGFTASASEAFLGGGQNSVIRPLLNKYVFKRTGQFSTETGLRQPIVNPGYFQDYTGSMPRTFNFSWDLIPNNPEEADSIMTIIYNLKKYTLPTSIGMGLALLSPYFFEIVINNPRIDALMNMTNVVCTNLSVNYSADGALQFLPDGIPKYIKLTMTFVERTLVTSEFY